MIDIANVAYDTTDRATAWPYVKTRRKSYDRYDKGGSSLINNFAADLQINSEVGLSLLRPA